MFTNLKQQLLDKLQAAQRAARELAADEGGQGTSEYIILFLILIAAVIVAAGILGPKIIAAFNRGGAKLDGVQ
jgi:hypothetical protein